MQKQSVLPKHHSSQLPSFRKKVTKRKAWIFYVGVLSLAAGAFWWAKAQGMGAAQPAPTTLEELRNVELTEPARFAALMEQTMTPEDYQRRYYAALGMTNQAAYFALFPKSPEVLEREALAEYAITHPPTIEEAMRTMTPDEREKFQKSTDAILHPVPPQKN